MWGQFPRIMMARIVVSCDELGFDCNYTATGDVNKVAFDYWDHMKKEHGIEYSPETLGNYLKKKIPTQIPAS